MDFTPLYMFPALIALLLLGVPVAFAMMGIALVFGWFTFGDAAAYQLIGKVDSVASDFVLAAVPLFVFMGSMLERSGIAEQLFEAMHIWTKRLPGGLALSTIVMCAIFAASTGVIGATEVVVGLLAMPVMLKHGYSKSLVSGTICAGGSLGTIIPPSIVVVILGPTANVSIADLFVAMVFPGLILAALYLVYIYLRCRLDPSAGPTEGGVDDVSLAEKLRITAGALIPPIFMIMAVLGSLVGGLAAPTEAAALGAFGAILLTIFYRSFTWEILHAAVIKTIKITCMIMLILLAGNMFTGVFIAAGGLSLTEWMIEALALSDYGALMLVLGVSFAAGLFLDWISIVLLFIPIFTPIIKAAGFEPVWFCMLFLLIIQTSYLTPPMAPAIFYLRGISPPEVELKDMFRGVIPFIFLQLLTLAIVMAFPQTALWLPDQLLGFK